MTRWWGARRQHSPPATWPASQPASAPVLGTPERCNQGAFWVQEGRWRLTQERFLHQRRGCEVNGGKTRPPSASRALTQEGAGHAVHVAAGLQRV